MVNTWKRRITESLNSFTAQTFLSFILQPKIWLSIQHMHTYPYLPLYFNVWEEADVLGVA